ncbi:30S ribosomal protein S13 [Candidatus Uhrbacteria bacterium]|nr:30S ribosomal protein S13 [Candidatus Uhrbacteria bacterium]
MATARIAGVSLPSEKPIHIALTAIYGVGRATAGRVLSQAGVDAKLRTKELTDVQVTKIRDQIEKKLRVEGELRREVLGNVKRLREIGSYRGSRHGKNLPVRGQRTRTNSRTVRGNVRKTTGSGRRVLTKT